MTRILAIISILLFIFSLAAKSQVTASFYYDPPVAATFCNPIPVYFHSTSTGPGALSIEWNFGVMPGPQAYGNNVSNYYYGSGTYTVMMIATHNASGAKDTAYQNITINNTPFPAFGMEDTTVCANALVYFKDFSVLTGNVVTYNWNFGDPTSGANNTSSQQNPTHIYTQPGIYNVTMLLVSTQGCSATVSNQVIIDPAPTVTSTGDTQICAGANTIIEGFGATQYTWSPSTGLNDTNISNPIASPSTTTTYIVTGFDNAGCFAYDTLVVNVVTSGTADAGVDQTVCAGTSASLQATGLSSYAWFPTTGLDDPGISNPIATPATTQVYIVSGTDQNGCNVNDTVVVYVNPIPTANAGNDIIVCEGQSTYLQGSGGNAFQWAPSNGLLNANSFLAFCSPTNTTTFTLTVSNGTNCTATDDLVVTVLPKPIVVTSNAIICPGGVANLSATGASTYSWFPSTGLSQTDISNPIALDGVATNYVVTGTAVNGCSDTAQVNIAIKIPNDLVALPGGTICAGEQFQLHASGMLSYEWIPAVGLDNPYVPEPYAAPPQSITYKVKGFDGCYFDSAFVEVKLNSLPPVFAGSDQQTFANNPVQLQAVGNGSFEWFPSDGLSCNTCADPVATVEHTTSYVVTNYNNDGCRTEDTVTIYVECSDALVFVPNAFTPNNDGKNERFYVRTKGLKRLDFFKVYTRTGQLVFETTNVDDGWDGTFKGLALPPGVFSYYAQATCSGDEKIEFVGNVTLIR